MLPKPSGDYAKGLLTVRRATEYLGTTSTTIYTKIWRREIRFIKLDRAVRLDIHDLDEMSLM